MEQRAQFRKFKWTTVDPLASGVKSGSCEVAKLRSQEVQSRNVAKSRSREVRIELAMIPEMPNVKENRPLGKEALPSTLEHLSWRASQAR